MRKARRAVGQPSVSIFRSLSRNRNTKGFAPVSGRLHPLAVESEPPKPPPQRASTGSRRMRQLIERVIKYFFAGNALVAVVVLGLITIFLFREGFSFFGENLREL